MTDPDLTQAATNWLADAITTYVEIREQARALEAQLADLAAPDAEPGPDTPYRELFSGRAEAARYWVGMALQALNGDPSALGAVDLD
jgi:hypothetical protein